MRRAVRRARYRGGDAPPASAHAICWTRRAAQRRPCATWRAMLAATVRGRRGDLLIARGLAPGRRYTWRAMLAAAVRGHTWRAMPAATVRGHTWRAMLAATVRDHTWRAMLAATVRGHTWRAMLAATVCGRRGDLLIARGLAWPLLHMASNAWRAMLAATVRGCRGDLLIARECPVVAVAIRGRGGADAAPARVRCESYFPAGGAAPPLRAISRRLNA